MTVLTCAESELMSPSPGLVRLLASADHVNILGWQEQGAPLSEYIRTVHPRCRRFLVELRRRGALTYHCNATVRDTPEPEHEPWPDFDQYLAYSAGESLGVPSVHYVTQNLTSKPHRRRLIEGLLNSVPDRGHLGFTGRAGVGAGEDPVDHHYPDPEVQGFWAPHTQAWSLTEHMDVPAPPLTVWNTAAFVIVSETMVTPPVVPTEKTWQAIAVGKPWVVVGPQGLNHHMLNRGYEPVVHMDIAWDHDSDWRSRVDGCVAAVRDYTEHHTPEDIHYLCADSVSRNRQRYLDELQRELPPVVSAHATVTANAQSLIQHLRRVQNDVSRR